MACSNRREGLNAPVVKRGKLRTPRCSSTFEYRYLEVIALPDVNRQAWVPIFAPSNAVARSERCTADSCSCNRREDYPLKMNANTTMLSNPGGASSESPSWVTVPPGGRAEPVAEPNEQWGTWVELQGAAAGGTLLGLGTLPTDGATPGAYGRFHAFTWRPRLRWVLLALSLLSIAELASELSTQGTVDAPFQVHTEPSAQVFARYLKALGNARFPGHETPLLPWARKTLREK